MSFWQNRQVLITGGASFIGSHLTDALVERGAKVRIVDDLSSGKLENIQQHLANGIIEFIQADSGTWKARWVCGRGTSARRAYARWGGRPRCPSRRGSDSRIRGLRSR